LGITIPLFGLYCCYAAAAATESDLEALDRDATATALAEVLAVYCRLYCFFAAVAATDSGSAALAPGRAAEKKSQHIPVRNVVSSSGLGIPAPKRPCGNKAAGPSFYVRNPDGSNAYPAFFIPDWNFIFSAGINAQ
jgi:hypothetical protein